MNNTYIDVSDAYFDVAKIHEWLSQQPEDGAVVTFMGKVRHDNPQVPIQGLFLEHYPAMTVKSLQDIVLDARQRWTINFVAVVHRVGEIKANEQIVFVGVSSAHRHEAFQAAEFIMDFLKNQAPFWKRECGENRSHWVEAKAGDHQALTKWHRE